VRNPTCETVWKADREMLKRPWAPATHRELVLYLAGLALVGTCILVPTIHDGSDYSESRDDLSRFVKPKCRNRAFVNLQRPSGT
jgi:hypothetical protein